MLLNVFQYGVSILYDGRLSLDSSIVIHLQNAIVGEKLGAGVDVQGIHRLEVSQIALESRGR